MTQYDNVTVIPDPARTIQGLRDTGYTFDSAVADLVDNSIAADATTVDIRVQMDIDGDVTLSLADDGSGMTREDLIHGMTYGSPKRRHPASLGKYGLGLKTASTAFCRHLSVTSRAHNSQLPVTAAWDIDHVVAQGEWLLQVSQGADGMALRHLQAVAGEGSGTVVRWLKVDRLFPRQYKIPGAKAHKNALKRKCDGLIDHLAMTYQRFLDARDLRARNVKIRVNGAKVSPWDPFQVAVAEMVADETIPVSMSDGGRAEFCLRAFILPRRDEFPTSEMADAAKLSSPRQGIYIYREERLLQAGGWLKMFSVEPHGTLLRVEFSFDHRLDAAFHLDVKKSQIVLHDDLIDYLKGRFLPAPRREANRRYRRGTARRVRKKAKDAHQTSNQTIADKLPLVGGPVVEVTDADRGEVVVTNPHGQIVMELPVSTAAKPGEVHVVAVDDVAEGLLFEPAIVDARKAVRISTLHPYYHKVYVPNFDRSVTVQGMDSLLWALCVGELNATKDATADAFRDMREDVSRILRKLVADLPDPDLK